MSKITTSDWKAWINEMPGPGEKPTLHVIGTVDTHNQDLAFLRKKIPQGTNPKILLLDLLTVSGFVPVKQPQQVHYEEVLANDKVYSVVEVFHKNDLVADITEISIIR